MIANLDLPDNDETGALAFLLRLAPCLPVFAIGDGESIPQGVDCMRRGASAYFPRRSDPRRVLAAVESAFREGSHELAAEAAPSRQNFGLIGGSEAICQTLAMIARLQDVDSTVLILGESGTGKEVVARAIHASSRRAGERFAAINSGAIPENLLESELFGHVKGAFTDASDDRQGIFERCSDGTLVLSEIGDMPLVLQAKLLRVLQERLVVPVGSGEAVPIGTRLLASTHRDILGAVKSGGFREDLFHRLSVVVLHIPPLRERKEDIPALTEHFLGRINERFHRDVRMPSGPTLDRMLAYNWPGNMRELENALERAVGLAPSDVMSADDLFAGARPALISLPLTEAKQQFE